MQVEVWGKGAETIPSREYSGDITVTFPEHNRKIELCFVFQDPDQPHFNLRLTRGDAVLFEMSESSDEDPLKHVGDTMRLLLKLVLPVVLDCVEAIQNHYDTATRARSRAISARVEKLGGSLDESFEIRRTMTLSLDHGHEEAALVSMAS